MDVMNDDGRRKVELEEGRAEQTFLVRMGYWRESGVLLRIEC